MIPASVRMGEGYNHIGDLSWDASEGGRLLLPLECYSPGQPNGGNTCRTGSIGVADPQSLQWRYYVKLDPTEIRKAMWNEVSPDGELVWTSAGDDLLAYRSATSCRRTKDPPGPRSTPCGAWSTPSRRAASPAPPSSAGGCSSPGRAGGPFRIWSIDLTTGARVLEAEREIAGESEGLATASVNGGTLQWLIPPFDPQGRPPTYGAGHSTLLSLRPGPPDPPPPAVPAAPAAADAPPAGTPRVRLLKRSRATVLRRRRFAVRVSCPAACSVRITVRARGRTIGRGSIRRSRHRRGARSPRPGDGCCATRRPVRLTLRITIRDAAGRLTRRTLRAVLR